MILSRRSFERREPERDAKCVYIFCEGAREYNYFSFFYKLSEKIKIEVYPIKSEGEDNSPAGLFKIACESLKPSEANPNPRYELIDDLDEVWIVFDKDADNLLSREPQIVSIKENCEKENMQLTKKAWNVAESNPCFEVWLYYHFEKLRPAFDGIEVSSNWKPFVNDVSNGGFDSRKHPQLIGSAITNSEENCRYENDRPTIASTQVYLLAKSIYSLVAHRLKSM